MLNYQRVSRKSELFFQHGNGDGKISCNVKHMEAINFPCFHQKDEVNKKGDGSNPNIDFV
jgi:hypothetical protein